MPEHSLETGWTCEAPSVEPPLAEIDERKQLLEIKAFAGHVLVQLVFMSLELVLFDYFVHVLFEKVHHLNLVPRQHVLLVLRHFEHDGRHGVAPVVEQVLLVLLDIHELMNNMKLHVKLSTIYCVLGGIVKMILNSASCELVYKIKLLFRLLLACFLTLVAFFLILSISLIEQIDHLSGHEVLLVVKFHLIRCSCPEIFSILLGLLVVDPITMLVHSIVVCDPFHGAVDVLISGLRSVEIDGRLLSSRFDHRPSHGVPCPPVVVVIEWLEVRRFVVITVRAVIWWRTE